MSNVSKGFTPTASGARYVQQLVKHWGHKFETSYADGYGEVHFSEQGRADFDVTPDGIQLTLTREDEEGIMRMRGVVEKHLDRFAFREAPLSFQWEQNI